MAVIETWFKQDLKKPVKVNTFGGNFFSDDSLANKIGIMVYDDGEEATLTGTVTANVIRADGSTVAVTGGQISGNGASVILPQAAYAVPGMMSVIIKLTNGNTVTTLGAVAGVCYRSTTDTTVDPGTIIPSVQALIAEMESAAEMLMPVIVVDCGTITSLPVTLAATGVSSSYKALMVELGTPSLMKSVMTVEAGDGTLTLSGTKNSGSTTCVVTLIKVAHTVTGEVVS